VGIDVLAAAATQKHRAAAEYAPHAAAGLVLIAAGIALSEILPVLKGAAGTNLRTVLLLSGFVALVPLDGNSLNRIPDAFAEAIKPN
jgi:hypothetical protein